MAVTVNNFTIFTPCKIELDVETDKRKLMYFVDQIPHDIDEIKKIIKSATVEFVKKTDNVTIYAVSCQAVQVYEFNDDPFKVAENSFMIHMNKKIIEKIINTMEPRYTKKFLALKDGTSPEYDYYEKCIHNNIAVCYKGTHCNIIPETYLYWPPQGYTNIYDLNYKVIIKDESLNFTSIYHLQPNDVQKLIDVRDEIINFFTSHDVPPQNIIINVIDMFSNNCWVSIKVNLRKILYGEVYYSRLITYHRTISIDNAIEILKTSGSFDNKFKWTLTPQQMKLYGINRSIKNVYREYDRGYAESWNVITDTTFDDFKKKFIPLSITTNKTTQTTTLCSRSVCGIYNKKNYILNLIPMSVNYINGHDKKNIQNYINKRGKPIAVFDYGGERTEKVIHPEAKYYFEILENACEKYYTIYLNVDKESSEAFLNDLSTNPIHCIYIDLFIIKLIVTAPQNASFEELINIIKTKICHNRANPHKSEADEYILHLFRANFYHKDNYVYVVSPTSLKYKDFKRYHIWYLFNVSDFFFKDNWMAVYNKFCSLVHDFDCSGKELKYLQVKVGSIIIEGRDLVKSINPRKYIYNFLYYEDKKKKRILDNYIKNLEPLKGRYYDLYFHTFTGPYFSFHLHVVFKGFKGETEDLRKSFAVGFNANHVSEFVDYVKFNYFRLDDNVFSNYNIYVGQIPLGSMAVREAFDKFLNGTIPFGGDYHKKFIERVYENNINRIMKECESIV